MRRAADFAGAALVSVLLAPILVGIGVLIALTDGPPILFRQTRVGKDGQPFLILKFRSMRESVAGPSVTTAGDARVTPVGRFLRKYKLDELPQFINVLRGDMSLIGPRPEVPDYVQFDDPLWKTVLSARPGITDVASLAFRDEEQLLRSVPDADGYYRTVLLPAKLRLNSLYLRSRSMGKDLRLLWMTALYSLMPGTFNRSRVLSVLRNRA
jgi:lipopolysaccharide/colanic/teichoic acid biosynthesis glycosyltransferase